MEQSDALQILAEILDRAQNEQPAEFHLISSLDELIYYVKGRYSTKVIIKVLKNTAKHLFNSYLKDVVKGNALVEELFAYSQLQEVLRFYCTEFNVFSAMIDEYCDYLCHGHFWDAFFGKERDRED